MGHPSDWDNLRSALSKQVNHFDSHAIELKPATDWETAVRQLAEDIPPNSILIGYSMGARLSLGVALENPEKIDGLILVSGNPGIESAEARDQRWIADQNTAQEIKDRIASGTLEPFLERWYQQSVFSTSPQEVRDLEIQRKLAHVSREWPDFLRSVSVSRQPNYWPRLHELSMPVRIVAGRNDEKYRDIAIRIAENPTLRNAESRIIDDCGHIVHHEQPEVLVELIRDLVVTSR